jgi:hypothetical protein
MSDGLAKLASDGRWDELLELLKTGTADVDEKNRGLGQTALWIAAKAGRADVVEALVRAGANVNLADARGTAPLSVTTDAAIATMLIKGGASVDAADRRKRSEVWMAAVHAREGAVPAANEADANDVAPLAVAATTLANLLGEPARANFRIQLPTAQMRIVRASLPAIRARVLEICIALQELELPAPQLIEIVTHACAPSAAQLPYHFLWNAVVLVKHFRSKK